MHARQLVELAGILSAEGPVLVRNMQRLSASGLEQYWIASKCRLDRWSRSLRSFSAEAHSRDGTARRAQWPHVRGVLEEILTGEVLTRVWTALACLCDRRHGVQDSEVVARSVLIGHLEARHRVLLLLVSGPGIEVDAAVKLNHLLRRVERWTDLLLGYLGGLGEVGDLAIDPSRARDFATDLAARNRAWGPRAWPLVLASLRMAFREGLAAVSPNEDLNQGIASAILACLPSELFDSTGQFQSLWLLRLYNLTNDVEGMIENLLGPSPAAGAGRGSAPRRIEHFRRYPER
ncbi:MAG: hypothetical protein ABSG86_02565 [Thermoguttaceae bacterium]|jgi:hypothetical protein